LKEKLAAPVYETENTAVGIRHGNHVVTSIRKMLSLTSPTSGCRSVTTVRLQTHSMQFSFLLLWKEQGLTEQMFLSLPQNLPSTPPGINMAVPAARGMKQCRCNCLVWGCATGVHGKRLASAHTPHTPHTAVSSVHTPLPEFICLAFRRSLGRIRELRGTRGLSPG
jgi:hypothetical protein